jgi:heme/copper-type cytochrome/quinol oxidase subunit 2
VKRAGTLTWVGLFAAPFAWAAQHVTGVLLSISQCHDNAAGPDWNVHIDTVAGIVTAVAALVAAVGLVSAVLAWRSTRDADDDDAPPAGRIHFLGIIGLTISPLFLAIILMSGLGTIFLPQCVQS